MRAATLLLALTLTGQTPAPAPAASAAPSAAPVADCTPRTEPLGAIGRASVVTFTGAVYGDHVCALVLNLADDGYRASFAAASGTAPIEVALTPGAGGSLGIDAGGALRAVPGAPSASDAVGVGPFIIAPGGTFAAPAGANDEQPLVVLAYAGQRIVLLATSAVTPVDLADALQRQPDLFGIVAPERAIVLAHGPGSTISVRLHATILGTPPPTAQLIAIAPRP
ncbi:MAG TPA: hypothetical protein VMD91_18750 [Candidatus Sulfotelmatobacter sp.]|nr:hypothetical protein [Candidatus Sulfotelmatobacter sp.]